MIDLRQARTHLAAARAGSCDHDQRLRHRDERIGAKAALADNIVDVVRIIADAVMHKHAGAVFFQALFKGLCRRFATEARDDHGHHVNMAHAQLVNQAQRVVVIGDA